MVDAQDLMIDQALHDVEAAPAGEQATSTASRRRQPWRSSQMTGPLSASEKMKAARNRRTMLRTVLKNQRAMAAAAANRTIRSSLRVSACSSMPEAVTLEGVER